MENGIATDHIRSPLSIVPGESFSLSDDECVARLAEVIAHRDVRHLDEVAHLIGRLAVTIE